MNSQDLVMQSWNLAGYKHTGGGGCSHIDHMDAIYDCNILSYLYKIWQTLMKSCVITTDQIVENGIKVWVSLIDEILFTLKN